MFQLKDHMLLKFQEIHIHFMLLTMVKLIKKVMKVKTAFMQFIQTRQKVNYHQCLVVRQILPTGVLYSGQCVQVGNPLNPI